MKIIYLAAHQALHKDFNITYQDISGRRDIDGDMMDIDLTAYDVIIATPPCNYWSRANYRRETSEYAQKTKYLLPGILLKLQNQDKPYILENVRNYKLFNEYGLYNGKSYIYEHGRHTYWTNIPFNPSNIKQVKDNINNISTNNRQGGYNVHNVIDYWLDVVKAYQNS